MNAENRGKKKKTMSKWEKKLIVFMDRTWIEKRREKKERL